ncbi:TPA: ATP-grasp domain-containing protein [Patescibacteria group bacterium]|nr:ATP-grasp domain-containing protein [Patescibacteria group bacterium]
MKFKEYNFIPLLFAGDINSYSMARSFYEEYQIKSIVYGKYHTGPNCNSRILDYRNNINIEKEETFLDIVNGIAKANPDKKILLIGCADSYVSLASKLKKDFRKNVVSPYIDYELMQELILKDSFCQMCEKYGIDYPKTFVYSKDMGENMDHGFKYPVILKASDSVQYLEYPFETQKKIYRIKNIEELREVIKDIYNAGYHQKLIIQDFIPGDDTNMYVLTGYCDKNSKVKLIALGNVLMEEHTPHGLGNHSVIINEVNEEISNKVVIFLEDINYIGFFNLDIKFDPRDNTYRFFEINTRQGRSNFYVTGAGYNLAKYVVDDYIYNKKLEYTLADKKKLWLVIPLVLAFIFVKSKKYRKEMFSMLICGKVVNPVCFLKDMGFVRFLRFFKTHISHFRKMNLE